MAPSLLWCSVAGCMSAAVFITIQPQQLSLVCENHSQGLKACLWIKAASDRPLVHGPAVQVGTVKEDLVPSMSTITSQ